MSSAGGGYLEPVFHQIKLVQVYAEETDGKLINGLDFKHLVIYVKWKVFIGKMEQNMQRQTQILQSSNQVHAHANV